jgi:hypothetical protein
VWIIWSWLVVVAVVEILEAAVVRVGIVLVLRYQ